MQLTERDRQIIRQVFRYRFLRSGQVAALVGGSKQAILRRLQRLFHHGYLERPRAQIEYYQQGGSHTLVYGLGDHSTELFQATANTSSWPPEWSSKNRAVKRLFLEHALLVSDVMVALELACRQHGNIRLLDADELALPATTCAHRDPFRWRVNMRGTKLGIMPDRVFGLEFSNLPADRNRSYFFLEADRGTMPVARDNLRQSSFLRKLLAYEATWTQNLHRTRFGFHRFRVLTITTGSERLQHLLSASRQLERGQGLFLFADIDSLHTNPDLLRLPWLSPRTGETVTLVDE